jgi:uncharacterized protein DUF6152
LKGKFWMILVLGIGGSIFSPPLFAHHGYAAYDTDKKVTLKGTVMQWHWSNPHCLLQMDVTDESGQVVHWIAETENPSSMTRMGWTDKSIKPGEQITPTAIPVKNGRPVGRIIEVVTPSGERLPGRVGATSEIKPEDPAKQ